MKCEEVHARLDEYVDSELATPELPELERHLRECPACRAQEQELRALLVAAAALPRELQPARDLWPELPGRLRAVVPFPRRGVLLRPLTLAAAAALLVALSSVVTWRVARKPEARVAAAPSAAPQGTLIAYAPAAGLLEAETEYARATGELLAALEARRATLSPETLDAVEQNLRAIDDALASLREALQADPGNQQLTQLLTGTHKRKVEALRRVVRLSRI